MHRVTWSRAQRCPVQHARAQLPCKLLWTLEIMHNIILVCDQINKFEDMLMIFFWIHSCICTDYDMTWQIAIPLKSSELAVGKPVAILGHLAHAWQSVAIFRKVAHRLAARPQETLKTLRRRWRHYGDIERKDYWGIIVIIIEGRVNETSWLVSRSIILELW